MGTKLLCISGGRSGRGAAGPRMMTKKEQSQVMVKKKKKEKTTR
jgi:hypothetical protein